MNDNFVKDLRLTDREEVLILARIAEQSEQYQDMIDILKPFFEQRDASGSTTDEQLSQEERNTLSVAYKNAIGLKRIA